MRHHHLPDQVFGSLSLSFFFFFKADTTWSVVMIAASCMEKKNSSLAFLSSIFCFCFQVQSQILSHPNPLPGSKKLFTQ